MSSVTLFLSLLCFSPLHWCRAHTHLYISLSRTHAYSFALRLSSVFVSLEWARLCHAKSCVFPFHLDVIARLLTDLETRRFGILLFHIGSGAKILGDVRSQFYGRIDEKFAEWETDVRLWQVECKLEDRDRFAPFLLCCARRQRKSSTLWASFDLAAC